MMENANIKYNAKMNTIGVGCEPVVTVCYLSKSMPGVPIMQEFPLINIRNGIEDADRIFITNIL